MQSVNAQQEVEFRGGIPLAPLGLANKPLGDGPFEYATAEGMDIRVVVLTKAIEFPTSVNFLPDGGILVTTRPGQLRILRDGKLDPEPVAGGPASFFTGESGLPGAVHGYIDIALHPRFTENQLIYLSYTKPLGENGNAHAVGRGRWDGKALTGFEDIWVAPDNTIGPGRIAFGQDGMLYVSTNMGDAQSLGTYAGKVLRLHDDGSVPKDNPFAGRADAKPEIYTYGHRSSLGLAVHPGTGEVWLNENGPNGGDEINILKPGRNYGWPLVSLGRQYTGPWQAGDRPTHEGYEPPVVYWTPAIAASGMAFYTGSKLPKWKGDVFVGALRTGEIPGTGHLERIMFNMKMEEMRRETLLVDLRQRIRDVRQGTDELLYVVTDEKAGAVLRIEPAD
jgi:glucose/arabinose dehydrogenase